MEHETSDQPATILPMKSKQQQHQRSSTTNNKVRLNTTIDDVPPSVYIKNLANNIFRTFSLSICLGCMIFLIFEAVRAYFQYPTQTSVSIIFEWPQAFPAVTVCNYSPLRYDRFIEPFLNYTNTFNLTGTSNATEITKKHGQFIRKFILYKINRNESMMDYLYPLDAMMISCMYNNIPCTVADFTWFVSSQYGLCYTFNAKLKPSLKKTIKENRENGLFGAFELRFYVHQHQYVPYLSNGVGMVVLVHDNEQMPNVEVVSRQLAPGQHHRLSYVKKISSFLSKPYTTCTNKTSARLQTLLEGYHDTDYGYSQLPCYIACLQAYTYEKCGCGNPLRWATRSIILPDTNQKVNISLCDIDNPCYRRAARDLMNIKDIRTSYCYDCAQECLVSQYLIKSSSVLAPPSYFMHDIKQFVEKSSIPLPSNWSTTWMSEIRSSYVSLAVTYESTRTEVYAQQPSISLVDVISNVGGQTGLWIGISFFSIVEIAELIYRMIRTKLSCFCSTVVTTSPTQESIV
ncbi:unnamed protein product [Adineta ricciae]|uniref:Uncharacterized protein n=1 Tax=Adineta ricciae TaxID=249248 RepID=A0A813S916_ADIRI|nr:unnamed protein product [Adineta ricciae]